MSNNFNGDRREKTIRRSISKTSNVAQSEPTKLGTENPIAYYNNLFHRSSNFNGENRSVTQVSINEEGLGTTTANQHPNKGFRRLTRVEKKALKVKVFDWMILVFGILVPVTAMCFGLGMGKCPASSYMPHMVFAIGLLSLIMNAYAFSEPCSRLAVVEFSDFYSLEPFKRKVLEKFFWLFVSLWFWELYCFFCMDVSFDSTADNYCNYWFYNFITVMNVFSLLGICIGWQMLYNRVIPYFNHPYWRV